MFPRRALLPIQWMMAFPVMKVYQERGESERSNAKPSCPARLRAAVHHSGHVSRGVGSPDQVITLSAWHITSWRMRSRVVPNLDTAVISNRML